MTIPALKVPKHQAGFSLTEMTFVVIIIGVLYHYFALWVDQRGQELMIERAINGFATIDEAVYAYYLRPGMGHSWPTDIDTLRQSDYLPADGGYTGFYTASGQPLSYELEPQLFSNMMFIKTTFNSAGQVAAVAAAFPTNGEINPDNDASTFDFQISIPIPGAEYAHRQLLKKSGGANERMTGDLYMGHHNIEEANQINATRILATTTNSYNSYITRLFLRATHAVGGVCAAGQIGRTASGGLLSCDTATRRLKAVAGGSQVKIKRGQTSATSGETTVTPPTGYTIDQCGLSVAGPPAMDDNSRNDRQVFSWQIEPEPNRWKIYAIMRWRGDDSSYRRRGSLIQQPNNRSERGYYFVVCTKDA